MFLIRVGTVCMALMLPAGAALSQDIAGGARVAQMQCSGCHQIGHGPRAKAGIAPSFADIAATKGTTQLSIEAFLSTPHEKMPNYVLSQKQIADVASYIMGLRQSGMDNTGEVGRPNGAN